MKKCPNGHEVSGDVKFCPQCGAEMLEDVAEDVRFCKKCGNERKGVEKFCSHCGHPFYGNIEAMVGNQDSQEEIQTSSLKKWLVSLLIIIPLLLIGGYFVNNHIQEKKRIEKEQIEKKQIEEKERAAAEEAERKRIEEENKPANRLYKIAKQGNIVWGYKFKASDTGFDTEMDDFTIAFFLYPLSKTTGNLSCVIIRESSRSSGVYTYQKLVSVYSISDDILRATLDGVNCKGKWLYDGDNIAFQIVNDGDKVKLIEIDNLQKATFQQMEPVTENGMRFKDRPA